MPSLVYCWVYCLQLEKDSVLFSAIAASDVSGNDRMKN